MNFRVLLKLTGLNQSEGPGDDGLLTVRLDGAVMGVPAEDADVLDLGETSRVQWHSGRRFMEIHSAYNPTPTPEVVEGLRDHDRMTIEARCDPATINAVFDAVATCGIAAISFTVPRERQD